MHILSQILRKKLGLETPRNIRCCHDNNEVATLSGGIFVYPHWIPNCMQNIRGDKKFSFPTWFENNREDFLIRQRHDIGQYECQECATVDNCFGLVELDVWNQCRALALPLPSQIHLRSTRWKYDVWNTPKRRKAAEGYERLSFLFFSPDLAPFEILECLCYF